MSATDLAGWPAIAGRRCRYPVAIVVGMTLRHRRVMQVAAGGAVTWRSDDVSTEEPLEIRVGDVSLSVTMRTPGDDFDLVAGFLVTEGIVDGANEIDAMRMCPDAAAETRRAQHRRGHAVTGRGVARPSRRARST